MKASTPTTGVYFIAFLMSFLLIALVFLPLIIYTEKLELSGNLHPPEWLAAPVAFIIIGALISLTQFFANRFGNKAIK